MDDYNLPKMNPDSLVQLNWDDAARCLHLLPMKVQELINQKKCFLAGGFIRSVITQDKINDIDLFVKSKEDADWCVGRLKYHLVDNEKVSYKVIETENAITILGYAYPIQIIHRWTYDSPLTCIKHFDFTIAQAAIWVGDNNQFLTACNGSFYADLAAKRLVYTNRPQERDDAAGGSLLRLLKFYRRGFSAPLSTVAAVISRMTMGMKDFDGKDEEFRSKVILGMLREIDPLIAANRPDIQGEKQ